MPGFDIQSLLAAMQGGAIPAASGPGKIQAQKPAFPTFPTPPGASMGPMMDQAMAMAGPTPAAPRPPPPPSMGVPNRPGLPGGPGMIPHPGLPPGMHFPFGSPLGGMMGGRPPLDLGALMNQPHPGVAGQYGNIGGPPETVGPPLTPNVQNPAAPGGGMSILELMRANHGMMRR